MTESQESPSSGEQFWKNHVLAAQQFMGSDQEYCRRNQLNVSTFAAYKLKMGFTKTRKPNAKAFVQVETKKPAPTPVQKPQVPLPRALPDPQWTAELVHALALMIHRT